METKPKSLISRLWTVWPALLVALAAAAPLAAQEAGPPAYEQPENLLLRSVILTLVIVVLWLAFYKGAYPFFLRYYRADFCKTVFWTLFLLYTLTWVFLASYLLFDVGFYLAWMKWAAAFLCALWLISCLILMLRRTPA